MSRKVRNKTFLSLEDQENLLIDRGLHIDFKDTVTQSKYVYNELLDKNYFDLINGFEDVFLDKTSAIKTYDDVSFYDFLKAYNFDVILTNKLFAHIEVFEKKLKSRISYFFSEKYCNSIETLENYIDLKNYNIPNDSFFKNKFCDHSLFRVKYGKNFIDHNKSKYDYINNHDKLPFWVAIKTLTFGELYYLLPGLPSNTLNKILISLGYKSTKQNDKDMFLNSVYIINSLRNSCAHFEISIRFNTKSNFKIHKNLISSLNLNPKRSNYELSLYDSIKVLQQFVCVNDIIFLISDFYDDYNSNNDLYYFENILDSMGERNISKWIDLLQ